MTRLISRAESFETIENALNQINFSSFDFFTIKNSLIDYVKLQYPETFNNYIESDEFIAILEIFAYVTELYNYRLDINASENFLSTAKRKQSVLKLAKFLSYSASRNIPGRGLVKIQSIKTTEDLFDIDGINLNSKTIIWNDPNNNKWKDQFLLVMNRIFKQEFGSVFPDERIQVNDVLFELYELENIPFTNGVFSYNTTVSGTQLPMELVGANLTENGPEERRPVKDSAFSILYGTDGLGDSSDTTGFFAFTKQGELQSQRFEFDGVTPNQTLKIDISNINDSDIWINNIDPASGQTLTDDTISRSISGEWEEVDISHAQNIIFNTNPIRNKYEVETLEDDKINIIFGDGEFADIPNGSFDIWFRTSINENITIPRNAIVNNNAALNYTGRDGNIETLTFTYSLINSIQNNAKSEDIEHIRKIAPAVYYTQDRMVNGKDYNTFMLQDTSILKLRSINRTFIGDSKYITWHDPKQSYESVKLFGDDLAIYYKLSESKTDILNQDSAPFVFFNHIQPLLSSKDFFTLLTSNGVTPDNIRTQFTVDETSTIITAMEQAALSPAQTLQLFYSIELDEWVFLIDETNSTSFDNNFTTDLPFSIPTYDINQVLFNVISPWDGTTIEAEGLIKIVVSGTDWSVTHKTQRIISHSPETRFWNSNDANNIISFDTLLSNQDEIIILDANKNATRDDLLTKNHHYNVVGQELVESNIPNTGLVDIHQLSILPIDQNSDAIPDNMDLPNIINPSFSLDAGDNKDLPFISLFKDISYTITDSCAIDNSIKFELSFNNIKKMTVACIDPGSSSFAIGLPAVETVLPSISVNGINFDNTDYKRYNGLTWDLLTIQTQLTIPTYLPYNYWKNSDTNITYRKIEEVSSEVTNIFDFNGLAPDQLPLDTKWYDNENKLLFNWNTLSFDPISNFINKDVIFNLNGTVLQKFDTAIWNILTPHVQSFEPIVPAINNIWLNNLLNDVYIFDGSWDKITTEIVVDSFPKINLEEDNHWVNIVDSNIYKFDGTNWEYQDSVFSLTIPNLPILDNHWVNTTNQTLYKFDGTNWEQQLNTTFNLIAPAAPTVNDYWFDLTLNVLNQRIGVAWVLVAEYSIEIIEPITNFKYWYDTTNSQLFLWDGTHLDLVPFGISNFEPNADLKYWYDTFLQELYLLTDDNKWVDHDIDFNHNIVPIDLIVDEYWVNSSDSSVFQWDGALWSAITIDILGVLTNYFWLSNEILYNELSIAEDYINLSFDPTLNLDTSSLYVNGTDLFTYDPVDSTWHQIINYVISPTDDESTNEEDTYLIGVNLYQWNNTEWINVSYTNYLTFYVNSDMIELPGPIYYEFNGFAWVEIINYSNSILNLGEYWFDFTNYWEWDGAAWQSVVKPERLKIDSINMIDTGANPNITFNIEEYVYFQRDEIDLDNGEYIWVPKTVNNLIVDEYLSDLPALQHSWKRENGRFPLNFLWMHRTPRFNLIDPAATNIIDTYIISRNYYSSTLEWLADKTNIIPEESSSLQLRTDYSYLIEAKMISDTVILHSGKIKILFGSKAIEELQARFKVIRKSSSRLTNNQIKTKIIGLIKQFFDINSWEFGETFYMTELAAKIHINMVEDIKSIVLVPDFTTNLFGDMFVVQAREDEIFQPHITINDIDIVENFTSENIKQGPRS